MIAPGVQAHLGRLAVVLTGGRSSRMGADKATALLGGRRMIDHVVASCRAIDMEVRLAGTAVAGMESITLPDPPGLAGPAAGLAAAMRAFAGADVLLIGTDQPFVRSETLSALLAVKGSAAVPIDGRRQPLCAVYRTECAPELERLLAARPDPSLQTLLDRVEATDVTPEVWRSWGEDGRSWLSLDTPDALAAAAASWPDPPLATIPS